MVAASVILLMAVGSSGSGSFPTTVNVMSDGTPTELWAAAKLAELLSLPLVKQPATAVVASHTRDIAADSEILVGFSAATLVGGVTPATLSKLPGHDSYFMSTTADSSVVIASSANSRRGTMNGIYAFLRALGFQFLTRNATVVPARPWSLPDGWSTAVHTFTPPLEQRDMDTSTAADLDRTTRIPKNWTSLQNYSIVWPPSNYSAAVGLDGFFAFAPVGGRAAQVNWGWGGVPNGGRAGYVATAYDLLCESLVADTSDCAGKGTDEPHPHNTPCLATWRKHPEWFVCHPVICNKLPCPTLFPCTVTEVNQTGYSQPCWSNTSLQTTMAANILKILRQNPDASSVSVTGMDGPSLECPPDGKANKEEGTTGGANFRAVKAIAAIVNTEFPHVKLQTLAYVGSFAPPKILKFGGNVIVQLCINGLDQFLPLSDPKNQKIASAISAWVKVVPTLYIWDYTCNFENSAIPVGNYFSQAKHIKELAALGVKGYYGEGCPHPGIDMIDLKTFLAARTAFDPSLDTTALITEFTTGFYSAGAAPHVREYMHVMANSFATANASQDYNGRPLAVPWHHGINDAQYGNMTVLSAAAALSAAKQAAAPGKLFQLRLSQAMLNILWVILQRWEELRQFATASGTAWPLPDSQSAAFDVFAEGLTFAFANDEPKSGDPWFYEHIPGPPHTKSVNKECDLACFKLQLGLK